MIPVDDVPPASPEALALLAGEGFGHLFHEHQHRACTLVDRYALGLACRVADELGLLAAPLAAPAGARTPEALLVARGFAPAFLPALRWLLAYLAAAGVLDAIRTGTPLPAPDPHVVRAAGLAHDPAYEPAYALLDEAARLYPRVARGEAVAERALLLRVRLWQAYFDNANPYYALTNRVVAAAAAARLGETGGGRVLEVGAGLGSATEALLDALGSQARALVTAYVLTEPVPFFRRRAEQVVTHRWPAAPLATSGLDVNQPWAAQGVEPASAALVWGVNVFHLAHDLDAVLAEARTALRRGGWLVAGEGIRPLPAGPVAAELPFQLLDAYTAVRLDPERRPTAGFLTASAWRAALEDAGFADVHLVPDAARVQRHAPLLLGAAVCGRRPAP